MFNPTFLEDLSIKGRKAEIAIKLQRVFTMLEQYKMEALLLQKHPNFSWMTAGGKSFVANCFDNGATALLITRKGNFAICNVIEAPRMIEEEQLQELGFVVLSYPWQVNMLEEYVKKHVSCLEKVVSDSPLGDVKAAPEWITPLRLQLTDNEIARYLYLGDKMSEGLERYLQTVEPGMTEYEIAGGISECIWSYGIEQVMHLVSADERANRFRHALPTNKKLEQNLIVSINGRYKGLVVTTSRMLHIGTPKKSLLKQYEDCCEMECLTMSRAISGQDELILYETLQQAYMDKGYPTMFDKHGQGGCQGYWPREYMITPSSHHIIQNHQVYCFNPVVDGTKSEDSFIVTEQGPVLITHPVYFPKLTFGFGDYVFERPGILVKE